MQLKAALPFNAKKKKHAHFREVLRFPTNSNKMRKSAIRCAKVKDMSRI